MSGENGKGCLVIPLLGHESLDHGAAVLVEEALADDGGGAEADAFGFRGRSEQVRQDRAKTLVLRAGEGLGQVVERGGWLDHFAADQFAVPCRPALVEEAVEVGVDEGTETVLGGEVRIDAAPDRVLGEGAPRGELDHGPVQALFVTEVVVDGGDVGPGPVADVANGGAAEPVLGEDFAGGFEETGPSVGR